MNEALEKSELYNIDEDWEETTDLSSEYPEVLDKLTQQLHDWKITLPLEAEESCFSVKRGK